MTTIHVMIQKLLLCCQKQRKDEQKMILAKYLMKCLMKPHITSRMVCIIHITWLSVCITWSNWLSCDLVLIVGLRCVIPYYFTFVTHAKGRWVEKKVYDVFCEEFKSETPEYYVCGWMDRWMDRHYSHCNHCHSNITIVIISNI